MAAASPQSAITWLSVAQLAPVDLGDALLQFLITYTHNLGANQEIIVDRLGNQTIHIYDDQGNVTQTADPLGGVTTGTYDARGNVLTEANPLGHNDGRTAALKFLTGYLIEKSLSVDNIFVIAMVFGMIKVPALYRHRVLFWGILGALVMRGIMITVGAQMIARFSWTIYLFGGILILTALKMMFIKEDEGDPTGSAALRWARKVMPVTDRFHGEHFFVRRARRHPECEKARRVDRLQTHPSD